MTKQSLISPELLLPGNLIGIISTARKISIDEINIAVKQIEDLGYEVLLGTNLFGEDRQFSGTVAERTLDLHEMYRNKEVKAILCARGGYGTVQLLPFLDNKIISNNPKWLIGYSDVTVLHSYLHQKFNIQTLHATMPINFGEYNKEDIPLRSMFNVLEGNSLSYKIISHKLNKTGIANAVLVGGNLSILYSLRGTPADIDTEDKILFIEDLDEYLYHIDRMMQNLKLSGKLSKLKALLVGGMNDMNDNTIPFGKTAKQIISDTVKDYDYPVIFDFPAGHIHDNYALPLGKTVSLKVERDFSYIDFY